MKLSAFTILTTLVSSGLAFLPALFGIESFITSSACHDNTGACHKLIEFGDRLSHNVSGLHGSWRQLRPKDAEGTVYHTVNFDKKFARATTLFANGTRSELVMPFETCRRDLCMYFGHDKSFTTPE